MTREEAIQILEDAAARVYEHFDAIEILASWNEDAQTQFVHRGAGNVYSRIGMAQELLWQWKGQTSAAEFHSMAEPHDDGEDGAEV